LLILWETAKLSVTKDSEDVALRFAIKNTKLYWTSRGKEVHIDEAEQCYPTYNWDAMLYVPLKKSTQIQQAVIYNEDGSIKTYVAFPEEFIAKEDFLKHFPGLKAEDYFNNSQYPVHFFYISGYFEYQGKQYINIIFGKKINGDNETLTESRYLDPDTGTFLPFTRYICYSYPNQWDVTNDFRIL
jgi:hypothetical protein